MASDAQICSAALTALGLTPISSLTQNAPRAEKCNAIYEIVRDDELSSHNWKFATKYASLVAVDEDPDFEYSAVYQLPNDFLKVVKINDKDTEYKVVGDKIYTNDSEIDLVYISKVTNSGEFSSQFVSLLIARLAKDLAFGVTNNRTLSQDAAANYMCVRRKATGIDSQQGTPRKLRRNTLAEARR